MRIPFALMPILMMLALSFSALAETAASLAERKTGDFLNQFSNLRIGITAAPGNGHQSAAATLIKRLRGLGYRGQLEVLYELGVAKKLEFLLPPFRADGPEEQFLPAYNAKFKLYSFFRGQDAGKINHTRLTIMAANDALLTPDELNTDYLVTINPFNWKPSIQVGQSVRTLRRSAKPVHYKPPSVTDVEGFLATQHAATPALAKKQAGLIQLIRSAKEQKIDLLSAYGLGVEGVGKLSAILQALEQLKLRLPEEFTRPVIVGLISNLNYQEWAALRYSLDTNGSLPGLKVLEIDDVKGLREVRKDEIAILKIGNVSQDVWNYLMMLSTLPPTVAGANGIDFMNQLGKPFMAVAEASPASRLSSNYKQMASLAAGVHSALENGNINFLSQFIRDSRFPNSFVGRTFSEHSQSLRDKPDRICEILLKAKSDISTHWLVRSVKWKILEEFEGMREIFY